MAADLVVHNGKIITVDGAFRVVRALAAERGRIVAVGADADALALAGPETRIIDARGRAVVPGLIDAHAHMDREGLREALPSLAGCRSVADVVARVAALARATRPGDWIVTMPVGEPPSYDGVPGTLAEGRYPDRHDLDRAAPDNPVYVRAIWGPWRHSPPLVSIANTRALALAGVGRDTPSPSPAIEIEKDPADGEPTGRFVEAGMYPTVELTLMRAAGAFTAAQRVAGLGRSMAIYNAHGTTSVFEGHGAAAEVIAAYRALAEQGAASVRAHLVFSPSWQSVAGVPPGDMFATWAGWLAGRGLGDDWLRVDGIFVDADDSPEVTLRASARPYTGWAGFHYDSSLPRDRALEVLLEAARAGIRVVGITPRMLELFAEVDRVVPLAGRRWVLGHVNTLDRDAIGLIRALGLVVTTHTNRYVYKQGEATARRLGAEREAEIVPLKTLRRAGIPFAFGSDNVPVTLFHPVWQAVARRGRDSGAVVAPSQRLDREHALQAATLGGAYLTFDEGRKGSLEVGKLADLAVLSDDPLTCAEDAIKDITAELTVVGGRVVHERR